MSYLQEKEIFNSKIWALRSDAPDIQRVLLNYPNVGYELALAKSKIKAKFDRKAIAVAFFVDYDGYLEYYEVFPEDEAEAYREFFSYKEEEIDPDVIM